MNRDFRETAFGLVQASIRDGAVNLDVLRRQINDKVTEFTTRNPGSDGNAHRDHLNIAAREVMGVIPRDQWQNRIIGESTLEGVARQAVRSVFGTAERNYPQELGLSCAIPNNTLGTLDPRQSLASMGVSCQVSGQEAGVRR